MHIIIYHNNHPIILCDVIDKDIASYYNDTRTLIYTEVNETLIRKVLQAAEQKDFYAGIFVGKDLSILKNRYGQFFKVILAGGGLVYNEHDEILLIFRKGFWDLPKGKLDDGETLSACALREVREETGIANILLHEKIITTYHTYQEKGKYILKESHWFKMSVQGKPTLTPQIEEEIEIAKWVSKDNIKNYMHPMYPAIRDILAYISFLITN